MDTRTPGRSSSPAASPTSATSRCVRAAGGRGAARRRLPVDRAGRRRRPARRPRGRKRRRGVAAAARRQRRGRRRPRRPRPARRAVRRVGPGGLPDGLGQARRQVGRPGGRAARRRTRWPCRTARSGSSGRRRCSPRSSSGSGCPLVVKPARGGSALGVSVVRAAGELPRAMVDCFAYGDVALVERFVDGRRGGRERRRHRRRAAGAARRRDRAGRRGLRLRRPVRRRRDRVLLPGPAHRGRRRRGRRGGRCCAHQAFGLRHLSRTDLIVDRRRAAVVPRGERRARDDRDLAAPAGGRGRRRGPGALYRRLVEARDAGSSACPPEVGRRSADAPGGTGAARPRTARSGRSSCADRVGAAVRPPEAPLHLGRHQRDDAVEVLDAGEVDAQPALAAAERDG